jgi:hypothetical protein
MFCSRQGTRNRGIGQAAESMWEDFMLARLIALIALIFALPASAVVLNLNTGAAGSAWTVTQTSGTNNGFGIGTPSSAVVLTGTLPFAPNLPGFEAFAWANPFGGAVWVGQLSTDGQFSNGGSITCGSPCGATAGNYVYSYTFDGSLGGSLVLSGFTGDNGVRALRVEQANNGVLYDCTSGGPGILCAGTQTSVTASTGTLSLNAVGGGVVTISALVQNLDGPGRNPSGFILAGTANVNDVAAVVPEPASWAMMLGGFALLGGALRGRTRAVARLAA